MTLATDTRLNKVLRAAGLVTADGDAPGLKRAFDEETLRLEPAFSRRGGMQADAVYETQSGPALIIKEAAETEVDEIRGRAWNLGLAPLLWVVTPREVRIYDAFKGLVNDGGRNDEPLATYGIDFGGEMARLEAECGRFSLETGAFWSSDLAKGFDRAGKVDVVLLDEVRALEDKLTAAGRSGGDTEGTARESAQELVTCTLFAGFLLDRSIASPAAGIRCLADIFPSLAAASGFLDWLHVTFNGDVFPEGLGSRIRAEHLPALARFAEGTSLASGQEGQMRLFRFRFDTIPIELISAIYESFARRAAASEAKTLGLHYTPVNLVHLAADPALDGLRPDGKVLDMTCGSGLFLVHALRRLAFKRRDGEGKVTREVVRDVLYGQVHGIDASRAALRIACFSLYLAALEAEPADLSPLKFDPLIDVTLLQLDALSTTAAEAMRRIGPDAIIGNLPWTHKAGTRASGNARRSPDQEFLRRAIEVVGRAGRVSIYVKGSSFMSPETKAVAFRAFVISGLDRLAIVNFSALRRERLFSGAQAPAVLVCANCGALPDADEVLVGNMPWSREFARTGRLSLDASAFAAVEKSRLLTTPAVLKAAMLGTPRDVRLVERLERLEALSTLLARSGVRSAQGFQVKGDENPVSDTIADLPALFPSDYVAVCLDNLRLPTLREREVSALHRERKRAIYSAPLLVVPKSAHRRSLQSGRISAAVSNRDLAFSHGFYGLSFDRADPRVAAVLCAVLNSAMATFQLLLGPGAIGIERPSFQLQDLRAFRVPAFEASDALASVAESALTRAMRKDFGALDAFVSRLYGLGPGEERLVASSVRRAEHALIDDTPTRLAQVDKPSAASFAEYVAATCDTVNAVLRLSPRGKSLRGSALEDGFPRGFAAVSFVISDPSDPCNAAAYPAEDGEVAAASMEVAHGRHLSERRFVRIYATSRVTVVKPSEARYWTAAAGMEDGDAILADHWEHRA